MLFEYLVVGGNNKEQTGKIESSSLEEAKKKLNEMGLSLLSIQEINSENKEHISTQSHIKKFLFSGTDKEQQEVEGEIEAESELLAYKRLIEEFGLKVHWIVDASLTKSIQEAKKKDSIKRNEDLAYERGIIIQKQETVLPENETFTNNADAEFLLEQKVFHEKIEKLSTLCKFFKPQIVLLAPAVDADIDKKLFTLEKIKMSNNLLLIADSIDDIVKSVLFVIENNDESRKQFKGEILQIKTLLKDSTQARIEKGIHDILRQIEVWYVKFQQSFFTKKDTDQLTKHESSLFELQKERKEIIKLCFFHFVGVITKSGELRQKHKEALMKLWKQYKQISQTIRQIQGMIQNMEDFYSRDYSFIIQEIFYFSSFLFGIYLIFFIILEISITKSKILPPDFTWKIIGSPFIISLVFLLFITMFISELFPPRTHKKPLYIIIGYTFSVFLSLLVFYNF